MALMHLMHINALKLLDLGCFYPPLPTNEALQLEYVHIKFFLSTADVIQDRIEKNLGIQ